MKKNNQFFVTFVLSLLLFSSTTILAQEEPQTSEYITITTLHWNMDIEDFDMDTWKSVEKEYLEKVTAKNEYIMGSSFYLHEFSPDNTELIYVGVYESWEAIEKASKRNLELEKEAWPDEADRKAFFKKQTAYYSPNHSDEIYSTIPLTKPISMDNTKDLVCYVRTSHLAFPEDGEDGEIKTLMNENFEKLIKNNPLIKGYYLNRHAWGKDGTEIMEAFYLDSMTDLDKMFEGLPELVEQVWPDEAVRKERGKKFDKYFTGVHGDALYRLVTELSK
ncbi:hypothetical protein APS56_12810 [Pseudalgibacter alginicilyticus]|uniref:ABM domain-containing protein n=1 Tax=Pseudalgibacter alginicilyticus TaxID=1736674 RepID=A0A0P0CIE1_9FLAO|nr:hypothetical protein [Pseudalgibacter alginicilyticus]ALJ05959.1 hypothetical protein APS56_12810 [Pseudalgibacter alginicilyticus]